MVSPSSAVTGVIMQTRSLSRPHYQTLTDRSDLKIGQKTYNNNIIMNPYFQSIDRIKNFSSFFFCFVLFCF